MAGEEKGEKAGELNGEELKEGLKLFVGGGAKEGEAKEEGCFVSDKFVLSG